MPCLQGPYQGLCADVCQRKWKCIKISTEDMQEEVKLEEEEDSESSATGPGHGVTV